MTPGRPRSFKLLRILSLRWIRVRPLRVLLTWLAVAGGVSLAMSVVVTGTSISWSFGHFAHQVAGSSSLEVIGATARGGLEASVVPKVARTPGVAAAIPVVQAITDVITGHQRRPVVVIGSQASGSTVMSQSLHRSLARGPTPYLATDTGDLPLKGMAATHSLDRFAGGGVIAMPLSRAQSLFNREGRLDVIYVVPRSSVSTAILRERLVRKVGAWNSVVPAGTPPPAAAVVVHSFLPLLGLLAVLAVGVAIVLVHDIVDLALTERRRSLAVAAALGASPSVSMMLLVDVLLIGLVGGISGVLGGLFVARTILVTVGNLVHPLTGVSLSLHAGLLSWVLAPLAGLLVAIVAAAGPFRRSRKIDVAAELAGRSGGDLAVPKVPYRRSLVVGLLTLAGLGGCLVSSLHGSLYRWQYPFGIASFALVAVAGMLVAGNLAPVILSLPNVASRRRGATLRLAMANLVRNPTRTGTMAVAIAGAVGVAFIAASFNRAVSDAIVSSSNPAHAHWVYVSMGAPSSVGIDSEARFTPSQLDALAHVKGVKAVVRQYGVLTGNAGSSLIGVETSSDLNVGGIKMIEGSNSASLLRKGEALVGPAVARSQGLRPGSKVRVDTPTGFAYLPVAGIWENGDFNGSSVFVAEPVLRHLYGPQQPSSVYAKAVPGLSTAALAHRISHAGIARDLHASTPARTTAAGVRAASRQVAPFWALQRALVGLAFLAVLSTLLLAGVQRRREYGVLAAVGFAPTDLARSVVAEASVVGIVGSILGGLLGVVVTAGLLAVIPLVVGYHDPFVIAPSYWAIYALLAVAVTVLASALPAWRAARVPVIDALREE